MNYLAALVALILFVSCSSETEDSTNVNQDRIFQLYSVDYDAVGGQFKWTASFTLGGPSGTTLELVNGSSVTANGQSMDKLTTGVSGTFYIKKEISSFSAKPQDFQWKDSNGKVFTNSITLNTVDFPSDLGSTFSKASGITITWSGAKLSGSADWVSLEAKSSDQLAIARINESGATSITLSEKDLSKLGAGQVELQLTRYSGWIDLKEATAAGGSIGYNYYSEKRTVTLAN